MEDRYENTGNRSLNIIVAPLPDAALPVREQLRRILEPLELTYELRNGAIMITAKNGRDAAIAQ